MGVFSASGFGRAVFLATLIGCLLTGGAYTPTTATATALGIGVAACLGVFTPPATVPARRSYHLCIAIGLGLALYCLFQSWSFAGNSWANPLWRQSGALIGQTRSAISVDPTTTRSSITTLLTPFVFYVAVLSLFGTDERAMKLLRWLVVIGAGFAAFGILQVSWLTDSLLFSPKTAYLESLTSVFVNRNTAGTLLGVASLLAFALVLAALREDEALKSPSILLFEPGVSVARKMRVVLPAAAMALVLLALFLTKSRGAVGSTFIAYLVMTPLVVFDRQPGRSGEAVEKSSGTRRRLLLLATALTAILAVVAMFGGMAIDRMEVRGVDVARLCLYESTIAAIQENWLFGTGFGTFASVFPSFRLPGCGYVADVFVRAHNVYLEGLLGLGILFVPVAAVVFANLVGALVTGLQQRQRQRFVPIVGIGVVVLVALHSLVDFSLQVPGLAAYVATCLGAVVTICLGRRRRSAGLYRSR